MQCSQLPGLLAGALLTTACFQSSTVLTLNADGTGTIDQRILFTQAAVTQLRQLAALAGATQDFDPVSEEQVREGAATLGPGVTYVSSTPIDTAEGVGRDIKYAFTDINQLRIDQAPLPPGGTPIQGAPDERVAFRLTRQPNGNTLLTISVPELPALGGDPLSQRFNTPSPEQLALIRPMLTGARLSIAIEPAGQLVRTNSAHVVGERVTLLEVDLDSVFGDEALIEKLQSAKTPDETRAILKNVPGLKMNLEPELTIEFQ